MPTRRIDWTADLIAVVRERSSRGEPVALIAQDLRCSQVDIAQMAAQEGIALTFTPAKLRKPRRVYGSRR